MVGRFTFFRALPVPQTGMGVLLSQFKEGLGQQNNVTKEPSPCHVLKSVGNKNLVISAEALDKSFNIVSISAHVRNALQISLAHKSNPFRH